MGNKIFFGFIYIAILSVNVNPQDNYLQIINEHWINEGYPHIIYAHFDYYSFFDDGKFVNYYGIYNSGTFSDILIHGKFIQKNNIIELEVIEKITNGFPYSKDKFDSFIVEIIEINENIVKIKYSNDEIITMNR